MFICYRTIDGSYINANEIVSIYISPIDFSIKAMTKSYYEEGFTSCTLKNGFFSFEEAQNYLDTKFMNGDKWQEKQQGN